MGINKSFKNTIEKHVTKFSSLLLAQQAMAVPVSTATA